MASIQLSKGAANGSLHQKARHMADMPNKLTTMLAQERPRIHTTLLALVQAVNQVTEDDRLVVATVTHLVNNGRARLTGTFKNSRLIIL
jgi:hypothetical protein